MPSKLVLAGVDSAHVGPWMQSDGTEESVELVGGLCEVRLEFKSSTSPDVSDMSFESNLTQPFPKCDRYRGVRLDSGSPITVRVHIRDV